jgi:cyclin B
VNLIDRYLEKKQIMRTKLQLVGVTAMLIACKYEEIYAPEVRDFVYITDKAYTKEEILAAERDLLDVLNYDVTLPSSLRFLEIYQVYLQLDETSFMFSRYLLELLLIDYKMIKYNPSLVAATAAYISVKISKRMDSRRITEVTGYGEDEMKECVRDLVLILDNVERNSLQAIRKKFSKTNLLEVAKIKSG